MSHCVHGLYVIVYIGCIAMFDAVIVCCFCIGRWCFNFVYIGGVGCWWVVELIYSADDAVYWFVVVLDLDREDVRVLLVDLVCVRTVCEAIWQLA